MLEQGFLKWNFFKKTYVAEKTPKVLPVRLFIFVFLKKCLSKYPNSMKPPLLLKNFWLRACRTHFDPLSVRTLPGLSFCYRIRAKFVKQGIQCQV